MYNLRVASSLVIGLAASGCYLSHEGGASADRDAGSPTRDAGMIRVDADHAIDAEVPLPREPPVDPGPDARPSDDPAAAGWEDEPGLDPDAACCEPIGPPTDIHVGPTARGGLAIEWNGDGWGVLYSNIEDRAAFQALDRDGALVGDLRRYSVRGLGARLEWADGRFAALIVAGGDGTQDNVLALMDRRGVIDAGWTDLGLDGFGARVARLAHGDRWVAVSAAGGAIVNAVELDARAQIVSRATVDPRRPERAAVVGLKSRVVVFFPPTGSNMIYARTLTTPIAESTSAAVEVLSAPSYLGMATTRLRDRAVVIATHNGDGGSVASLDPFTGETLTREESLPPVVSSRYAHDATGLDGPGLVAACFGVEDGEVSERAWIELRVFGADGHEAAGSVRVTDLEEVNGVYPCAVGSDGERIFVAWQAERRGNVRVQGFRLRR